MITRRNLLKIPAAAAATAAFRSTATALTPYSMPGLFPGRVVSVRHSGASVNLAYQTAPIQLMVRRGMMELTGQSNYIAAWHKLFQAGDRVGIKVNGNSYSPAMISSPVALVEVISGLLLAGVRPFDIVVFERYHDGLYNVINTLPGKLLPSGVRGAWSTAGGYIDNQTGISGYNSNYYVDLPQYLLSWQSASDPSHTRSYVSLPVSQVSKIISLTPLKDHQAAGVTAGLKNLTIGCFNNCNRFHDNGVYDDSKDYLVNAIPALISAPAVRNKVVLSIVDGVHCLINGGPVNYSEPKWGFVVEHQTMYFATDVVAGDRIAWLALNSERSARGLPPEETAGPDGYDRFAKRQPQHIIVAGQMGLGEYRDDHIDRRQVNLG